MAVSVSFWGVRGSIPCCSAEYTEYGGNTSCVQLDFDGRTVILDAGSGLRPLGDYLIRRGMTDFIFLISHTHWDHICGFPFFSPVFEKETDIRIYSSVPIDGGSTKEIFSVLMSTPFFPLPLHAVPSDLQFYDFRIPEQLQLLDGELSVETVLLNHPNGAAGYRLNYKGTSVSYISDFEHKPDGAAEELADFVKDSDLMIYDAMFSPEEYLSFKGWGHSTWRQAALLTQAAKVKQTALFHHAPSHTDAVMREIERQAHAFEPRIFAAKENMTVTL